MKLVAAVMAWQAEEYLSQCIEGLHLGVDAIVVLEGAFQETIKHGEPAHSTDNTMDILYRWQARLQGLNGGLTILHANTFDVQTQWQLAYEEVVSRFPDCWMLTVDDDEIYTIEMLMTLRQFIHDSPNLQIARIGNNTFVNDFWTHFKSGWGICFNTALDGWSATSSRAFGRSPEIDSRHAKDPEVMGAPFRYYHYSWVRGPEHWARWMKWCPHKRVSNHIEITGDYVTPESLWAGRNGRWAKVTPLKPFDGEHPEFMRVHPRYTPRPEC